MIAKDFDILATSTSYYNYFDGLNKIFLDLYLVKFLDTSIKSFYVNIRKYVFINESHFSLNQSQMMDSNKRFH